MLLQDRKLVMKGLLICSLSTLNMKCHMLAFTFIIFEIFFLKRVPNTIIELCSLYIIRHVLFCFLKLHWIAFFVESEKAGVSAICHIY